MVDGQASVASHEATSHSSRNCPARGPLEQRLQNTASWGTYNHRQAIQFGGVRSMCGHLPSVSRGTGAPEPLESRPGGITSGAPPQTVSTALLPPIEGRAERRNRQAIRPPARNACFGLPVLARLFAGNQRIQPMHDLRTRRFETAVWCDAPVADAGAGISWTSRCALRGIRPSLVLCSVLTGNRDTGATSGSRWYPPPDPPPWGWQCP